MAVAEGWNPLLTNLTLKALACRGPLKWSERLRAPHGAVADDPYLNKGLALKISAVLSAAGDIDATHRLFYVILVWLFREFFTRRGA